MSKTTRNRDKKVKDNLSGWDKAIADAEKGIARLRAALAHALEMKRSGEPWPEDSKPRPTTSPLTKEPHG